MKLVFLDFDGVLNGLESTHPEETGVEPPEPHFEWSAAQLDHDKIMRLNRIVKETGAYVVLITSWKSAHGHDFICRILRYKGFEGFILGFIEQISRSMKNQFLYRADEIEHWLDHVPGITSYVILDDMNMHQLKDRHVQTDMEVGLQDEHIEKAVEILNRLI